MVKAVFGWVWPLLVVGLVIFALYVIGSAQAPGAAGVPGLFG